LGQTADTRHAVQEMAVNMIEKTLLAQKSALESQVAVESEKVEKEKASEEELVNKVKELESLLESRKSTLDTARSTFEQASVVAQASADAFKEKEVAHKAANDKIMETKNAKATLGEALENHGKAEAGLSWKQLSPFVSQLEIETSLLTALPSTCDKPKEQRGSFDLLVLEELSRAFASKIAELSAAVEKDSPAVRELEAAMQASAKENEQSQERRKQFEEELNAAAKEVSDCEETLKNAMVGIEESKPQLQALSAQLEESKTALRALEDGALTIFAIYKNSTTEVVEAEAGTVVSADS